MVTLKIRLSQVKKEARELREDKRCPSKDKCIGIFDWTIKLIVYLNVRGWQTGIVEGEDNRYLIDTQ